MDDKSWIKLYRKAKENEILQDPNAWFLFTWILLSVDRKTGKWKTGRFLLRDLTGLNPSTIYKILQRLEAKYKVVTLRSNNKYTEISVSKWAYYQQDPQVVTPSVTSREQQSNTYQEVENKRIRKDSSKEELGITAEQAKKNHERLAKMKEVLFR